MAAVAATAALPKDVRLVAALAGLGCLSVTPTVFFDHGWYSLHSTVHYLLATGPFVFVLGALAVHLIRHPVLCSDDPPGTPARR